MIDEEISKLIEGQYERAKELLRTHRDKLETLAQELLTKEVIFRDNLVAIFGERPWQSREERLAALAGTAEPVASAATDAPTEPEAADTPVAPQADPEATSNDLPHDKGETSAESTESEPQN